MTHRHTWKQDITKQRKTRRQGHNEFQEPSASINRTKPEQPPKQFCERWRGSWPTLHPESFVKSTIKRRRPTQPWPLGRRPHSRSKLVPSTYLAFSSDKRVRERLTKERSWQNYWARVEKSCYPPRSCFPPTQIKRTERMG